MGKKKHQRQARKQLEKLVAGAQEAADRAEKAAGKAKKQRKRAEAAAASGSDQPVAALPPAPGDEADAEALETGTPETQAPESQTPSVGAGPGLAAGQLATATKTQLLDLARSAGIPGRTRMSRDELVAALGGQASGGAQAGS